MWESRGVRYLLCDRARACGVVAGFTTRVGGVSPPPYSSLNIGLHVGDVGERVLANRRRLAAGLGVDVGRMVFAEQSHSNGIEVVDTLHCGMGACDRKSAIAHTDGLITSTAGVMLVLMFADCVPIILFVPEVPVVAVVHAGWRGTAASVAIAAVSLIVTRYKVSPSSIRAVVGPSIGPCCYEVSREVAAHVRAASQGSASPRVREREDREQVIYMDSNTRADARVRLDLASENAAQLLNTGIPSCNIEQLQVCTSCHSDLFYSYRACHGVTGRFAAFAYIPPRGYNMTEEEVTGYGVAP